MNFKGLSRAVSLTLLALVLASCESFFCFTETHTYETQVPVYLSPEEVNDIKSLPPQAIKKPGKIYLHHKLILINEINEGIHVLDNSDPRKPVKLAFLSIPGNHDLLVRQDNTGTVLYADNHTDLVAIDMGDPGKITVLKRLENVFGSFYPEPDSDQGILIGYETKEITETYRRCPGVVYDAPSTPTPSPTPEPAPSPDAGPGGPSQGGSLARFASLENFLYTIDGEAIQVVRLETLANPQLSHRVPVDFGIETLFPYAREEGDQLYVGGNAGMYILDASDPANLRPQGKISHVQSCDPVVVQGDLAYVTLQGSCFGQENRLEIIDVSDPSEPRLITDYPLQEPFGLGVDGEYLFVCDGAAGLKVYKNARSPKELEIILQLDDVKARDIIPWNDTAIVIGENGFFQYDYSNLAKGEMTLLSSIFVEKDED